MSNYQPGYSNIKDINKKLKEYRAVEQQIEDAIIEKRRELARIEAAKHKLKAKATYEPTQEAWDYWEAHALELAQQPRPIHGGPAGLRRATAEAAAHDAARKVA
jgi:hypothetical protein